MNQSSIEKYENKVNLEILRSRVFYMNTNEFIINEDVLAKSLNHYWLMKNVET